MLFACPTRRCDLDMTLTVTLESLSTLSYNPRPPRTHRCTWCF